MPSASLLPKADMMIVRDNNLLIISPPEEFTVRTVAAFVELARSELHDYDGLLVNLIGVIEVDTAGFQVLVALKNEATAHNKSFDIVGMSMDMDEIISLYHANSYLSA